MLGATFEVWQLSALCAYEKYTDMYTRVYMLYVFMTLDKTCYQRVEWMAVAGLREWLCWYFVAYF